MTKSVASEATAVESATMATDDDSIGTRVIRRSMSLRSAVATGEVQRIVAATFDVIADSQSPEPSLREVLRKAELSTATFYRHFRSRDELLLTVLDEGSLILSRYLEHRMQAEPDPIARIATWVEGIMQQAANPTSAVRTRPFAVGSFRVKSQFPDEHHRLDERLVKLLEEQIVAGNQAGLCHCSDPEHDAWAISDLTRASLLRHLFSRSKPTKEHTAYLVGLSLRITGAQPRH